MASQDRPAEIKGGCLCEAVRYKITFPTDHKFENGVSLPLFPIVLRNTSCDIIRKK